MTGLGTGLTVANIAQLLAPVEPSTEMGLPVVHTTMNAAQTQWNSKVKLRVPVPTVMNWIAPGAWTTLTSIAARISPYAYECA